MHLSIGLLCLALTALIGFHLGSRAASADFDNSGVVVGIANDYFLMNDGSIWALDAAGAWRPHPPVPVPVADIKLWDKDHIVTKDDVIWFVLNAEWVQANPPYPAPVEPTTWGRLKTRY
jgi:hypothetical protein